MNNNKIKLFSFILAALLLAPSASQAYFATGQTATRLTSNTVLYTVSFQLGFLGRELYAPIVATRGGTGDYENAASFEIVNENGTVMPVGEANALILTDDEDAVIEDGQYYLPDRKSAEFTLVAFLTIPEEEQSGQLSLQVTDVPFTLVEDGVSSRTELDDNELEDYLTPAINFGSGITVSTPVFTTVSEK